MPENKIFSKERRKFKIFTTKNIAEIIWTETTSASTIHQLG
jgi:hypothetical protein